MKSPNIIKYKNEYWYKKIIPYKYKTKENLYGYIGSYINYNTNEERSLVIVIDLAKWQVEKALYEYLKSRKFI